MVKVRAAYSRKDIEELLSLGGEIDIAVAYVGQYGMDIIHKKVKNNPGITKVRLLVDLKNGATEPDAVKTMLELSKKHGSRFECKEYYIWDKEHPHAGLHAKLLISKVHDSVTFLTGSCNLTENALEGNKEHGVQVKCGADESPAKEVLGYFRELWDSSDATEITYERYREYAELYKPAQEAGEQKGVLSPPSEQSSGAKYWLFKCNVKRYTFETLLTQRDSTDSWHMVRGALASKRIRDEIKKGDGVLIYHCESNPSQVVGTAHIVRAWDELEPKLHTPSKPDKLWPRVDIKADDQFAFPVTLSAIRSATTLQGMSLLRENRQTTVQPVTKKEWYEIIRMGMGT